MELDGALTLLGELGRNFNGYYHTNVCMNSYCNKNYQHNIYIYIYIYFI